MEKLVSSMVLKADDINIASFYTTSSNLAKWRYDLQNCWNDFLSKKALEYDFQE